MCCLGFAPLAQANDGRFDLPKKSRTFDRIQYYTADGKRHGFSGDLLKWNGPGDCSQDEGQMPIISVGANDVTVRNAVIIRSPDGIHVRGKRVLIENIVFPDVCEDAITAHDADELIIRNCSFRGADDKAIQINGGKNVLIENCYFENSSKPIRVKADCTVTVRNCTADNVKWFVYADGPGARVVLENNTVTNVRTFVHAEKDAEIVVGEGNKLRRAQEKKSEKSGGKVTGI